MILERYETLCKERGEFPTKVAVIAGYDKSAITYWRKQAGENNGVCSVISSRLRIMAEHLGTTSDYLLGMTDDPHPTTPAIIEQLSNNPRKMILFDELEGMSDKSLEQVIRMARAIKGLQDD